MSVYYVYPKLKLHTFRWSVVTQFVSCCDISAACTQTPDTTLYRSYARTYFSHLYNGVGLCVNENPGVGEKVITVLSIFN